MNSFLIVNIWVSAFMQFKHLIAVIIVAGSGSCRTSAPPLSTTASATAGTSPAKNPGILVLLAGQVHVLRDEVWSSPFGKETFGNDLQFYRGSKDYFFAHTSDPQGLVNKTYGWRWWKPQTREVRKLVTPSKLHRPYRYLETSKLFFKSEHFRYTEIVSDDEFGRRVEHARSGRFLYNYAQNGNYTYIDWPSIGQVESKYFSNLVPGKQMLLKLGDLKKMEVVLAAASAILQPRFVAEGKSVCYFKPGSADVVRKEKSFFLECVALDGHIRPFGIVRDHLNGSRLPPAIWAFEGSDFILIHRYGPAHPAYKMSGPIEMIDVTGKKNPSRFNLASGWMLVPQISARGAGIELEPYVVAIHKDAKKVRVLRIPDLSLIMESDLPGSIDRQLVTATYLP